MKWSQVRRKLARVDRALDKAIARSEIPGAVVLARMRREDEVLEQITDLVAGKGGDKAGAQAETAPQAPGDVVFAAAFPDPELPRGADTAFTWIEPQHDLAKRDDVVSALLGRTQFDCTHSNLSCLLSNQPWQCQ